MAPVLACRGIHLSLRSDAAGRTYGSKIPGKYMARWTSHIKRSQRIAFSENNEAKESRLLREMPDVRRERGSLRTGSRFPAQSSEDGSSYEISYFEPEPGPEWYGMESDFIEDTEWSHDIHKNSPGNVLFSGDTTEFNKVKEDAGKMAIESLATRACTTAELMKKLRGKNYPLDVIESVIAELKSRGFLDDGLYAESFSQSRWISLSWGPRRIRKALLQKGVNEADIERAINAVFKDDSTNSGLQVVEWKMLAASLHRFIACKNEDDEEERSREGRSMRNDDEG
ncbi:unnamed protein product [Spirodela intermedia]|uniref:Regulatory protein RecX n=1 Tax=Spirodela intermedia TaxID=51605 RepID=A0A7I8JKW3_SPIIN|nr:unnamed protein product [Spirodela intermedia]CAA6670112.1 unnamed protein product [Spirodela intermedia]